MRKPSFTESKQFVQGHTAKNLDLNPESLILGPMLLTTRVAGFKRSSQN